MPPYLHGHSQQSFPLTGFMIAKLLAHKCCALFVTELGVCGVSINQPLKLPDPELMHSCGGGYKRIYIILKRTKQYYLVLVQSYCVTNA